MNNYTYVVTKDIAAMGRMDNICVTQDPDEAERVCREQYEEEDAPVGKRKYHTFIEVWEHGGTEPAFVTRKNPAEMIEQRK